MTAFETTWNLMKALLPDLDFDVETERILGYNPYKPRDVFTQEIRAEPDVARELLENMNIDYPELREEDMFRYGNQKRAWDKELNQNGYDASNNYHLFQFPHHILERMTGRHSRDMKMPWSVFERYATQPIDENNNYDWDSDESIMSRYIDEMERRGQNVVLGSADYDMKDKMMARMLVNPGFTGQGIGQHLLGSILQDFGRLTDTQFSPEGRRSVMRLGNKLTLGDGAETRAIPAVSDFSDKEDFLTRYYGNKGIIERILGDIRFTQPYGFDEDILDLHGDSRGYWMGGEDNRGLGQWNPPDPYPFGYSPIPYDDGGIMNPKASGRYPLEILYTGESDTPAITNLGED
jgi:GNAT superfamily N-acetyltransferase